MKSKSKLKQKKIFRNPFFLGQKFSRLFPRRDGRTVRKNPPRKELRFEAGESLLRSMHQIW
jgi:hypothetical protein